MAKSQTQAVKSASKASATSTVAWPPEKSMTGKIKDALPLDALVVLDPEFANKNPRGASSGAFVRFGIFHAMNGKTVQECSEEWARRAKDPATAEYFGGVHTFKAEYNYSAGASKKRPNGYVCLVPQN